MADVSLPVILARNSPGTAMAAMMLMIATTISSSMSVKPCSDLLFMSLCPLLNTHEQLRSRPAVRGDPDGYETGLPVRGSLSQPRCQSGESASSQREPQPG